MNPYIDSWEAFEELCYEMGEVEAMRAIIDALSADELGENVEWVARMNDVDLSEFEG